MIKYIEDDSDTMNVDLLSIENPVKIIDNDNSYYSYINDYSTN